MAEQYSEVSELECPEEEEPDCQQKLELIQMGKDLKHSMYPEVGGTPDVHVVKEVQVGA